MSDFNLHTVVVVPAALKNGANTVAKKYKLDTGNVFTRQLYPLGSTVFTTPTAYIACMKLPIHLRIRLETLVSGLNNANVYIEDVDVRKTPKRVNEIITELNLMPAPTPGL